MHHYREILSWRLSIDLSMLEWGADGRVDDVLSLTIKCLMTHLLDVVCWKNVILAMSCVDKIQYSHKILSDIMNINK